MRNKELLSQWVASMRRDKWQPTKYSYICSSHFEEKLMYTSTDRKQLLANAIPTIFSFPEHLQKPKAVRVPRKREIMDSSPSIEVNRSSNERGKVV